MINKQQCATAAPRRSKTGFGFSQTGRRLRLWEPLSIGQDEARPVLASAKPGAVSAFGLYFPTGKSPQLESRREKAVDPGGDAKRLRLDRLGEPSGERLSQEAEAAAPVFRLPVPERRLRRSATGSRRVGGSADRADLCFLQFSSAGGPAGPETRSDPKPSGGAGARI